MVLALGGSSPPCGWAWSWRVTADVVWYSLLYSGLRGLGGLESGVEIKWKSSPTLQVCSGELIFDF